MHFFYFKKIKSFKLQNPLTFKKILQILGLGLLPFLLSNCERDIEVDLPEPTQKIVVEASIETGQAPSVILNSNFPYFGTFDASTYQQGFINDAQVTVSDGEKTVALTEYCWSTLDDFNRQLLLLSLGDSDLIPDDISSDFDYCVYSVADIFNPAIVGETGKTYTLNIQTADGKELSATTHIPEVAPLDSLWIEQHNDPEFADYWRVMAQLTDPDTLGNYYRVFTQQNDGTFTPPLRSVFDDLLINGLNFFFPVDRGQARSQLIDIDTYGYFEKGDSVTLKWATIDFNTYEFWRTLEFGANTNGPLGTQTKVVSNINGGIGIWAGYSASFHSIVVE